VDFFALLCFPPLEEVFIDRIVMPEKRNCDSFQIQTFNLCQGHPVIIRVVIRARPCIRIEWIVIFHRLLSFEDTECDVREIRSFPATAASSFTAAIISEKSPRVPLA
jgi:hypothetical protein